MSTPLHAPAIDLLLRCEAADGGALAALLHREIDALVGALQPWGRFASPVYLRMAPSQAALRDGAPRPTALNLRALAAVDGIVLLDPQRWLPPPTEREIARTLRHELAHVLLFQRCAAAAAQEAAYIPTWFREGMALIVADGAPHPGLRRAIATHPRLGELPDADDALIAQEPHACDQVAALLFAAWMDRFGALGLTALCRAMRSGHGFGAAHDKACAQTATAWTAAWIADVRREARST